MLLYTNEQLATVIVVPVVSLLLVWTVAIFHKNRKRWGPYDIVVVAILIQSVLRNISIVAYTILVIVKHRVLDPDYCSSIVWIFNSVHTFQASSLSTLAVVALFSVKLYAKQQHLKQYLTATHVIYHLCCLTTLCACVGVAAILAQQDVTFRPPYRQEDTCQFMPFQLDVKFNVFIIVLHIFLALVSTISSLFICAYHLRLRRRSFDYLKKSTSDLSELSLNMSVVNPSDNLGKGYYDTYTIQKAAAAAHLDNGGFECVQNQSAFCTNRDLGWHSDMSNISTTVSSTNSRRPCLAKKTKDEEESGVGLQTMYPILIVCYLFHHVPVIVLCIFPWLISPWPVSGGALWMGQLQDLLIPIGLGLVDTRFCKWVSKVYKCSDRQHDNDKLPHVGLDGKFRPFGSSQPQSLDVSQNLVDRARNYSNTEPKFPITNGSLYTSLDGRLPIIHNYRRHKDTRGAYVVEKSISTRPVCGISSRPFAGHSLYLDLHSSHLKRHQDAGEGVQTSSIQPRENFSLVVQNFPSASKRAEAGPKSPVSRKLVRNRRPLQKRASASQDSLRNTPLLQTIRAAGYQKDSSTGNLLLEDSFRPKRTRSEDSIGRIDRQIRRFQENPDLYQNSCNSHNKTDTTCLSSDDEYYNEHGILNETDPDFDGNSSQSSYSITTEANCDFEFYNNKPKTEPDSNESKKNLSNVANPRDESVGKLFKITRSNSKRSLENLQNYIEESVETVIAPKLVRSSSFVANLDRSNSKSSDCSCGGGRRAAPPLYPYCSTPSEYLDDVYNHNVDRGFKYRARGLAYGGSVPDFKRIFISEYL